VPRYAVGGRSAATAATANNCAAALWNPHATKSIKVREIWVFKTVATADNHALQRITARGTPGSTVTPDANSSFDCPLVAPQSGALLDLAAYTVQPTLAGGVPLARANLPAAIGSGFIWVFAEPIEVNPGTGLAIITPVATILQPSDFTFVWDE
jgi:hypothetical protein